MKYLLDTHAFLWIVSNDEKLSKKAAECFLDNDNKIFLSIASIWELAIKKSIGKIDFDDSFDEFIRSSLDKNNIQVLNISLSHVIGIESLPLFHRDPFDRIIISQAMFEKISIISNDGLFEKYSVDIIW